jgi:hypothetical protein
MTQINGRLLMRDYERECPTCHGVGHLTREGLDYDAYWSLDYDGNEASPATGGWLYDKVAWPTLRDAQRKHREDQEATRARWDNSKMGQYLARQRASKSA